MSETIRIRPEDMSLLRRVAKKEGISIVEAASRAVDALRREIEKAEEVARMNANAEAFNAEAEDVQDYAASW